MLHCKSPARRARTVWPAATRIQPLFSVDRALLREVLWRRQANSTPNAQKMTAKLYHSSHITAINRCQVETTLFYATFCCKPSWIQHILHLHRTAEVNYSVPPMILQYTMHELPRTALVDCNHRLNSTKHRVTVSIALVALEWIGLGLGLDYPAITLIWFPNTKCSEISQTFSVRLISELKLNCII